MTITGNILQQIIDEPNPFQISNEVNKTSGRHSSGKIAKSQILSSLKQDNQSAVGSDSSLESVIQELDKYASKKAVSNDEKESIRELIEKKRELFRIKLATSIKKEEIEKLNAKTAAKRNELQKHEEALEADIDKFDNFLKDSDRNALEAVRNAEKEHKLGLEKKSLVKRLKLQLEGVQTRIIRNHSDLEECKELKSFLTSLTPEQWFEKSRKDKSERQENRRKTRIMKRQAKWREDQDKKLKQQTAATQKKRERVRRKHQPDQEQSLFKRPATPEFDDEALTSSDEEVPFYFEEPEQLLDFFASMEEENLFLIQSIQEASQSLDELELRLQEARIEKGKVTNDKVEELKKKIKTKKELSQEIYCRLQGSRHVYKYEEVKKKMQSLYNAVSSAHLSLSTNYKAQSTSNIFHMLADIERELEITLERLGCLPKERLRKEAKAFAKQRRENNRKKKNEEKSLKRRK